MRSSMPLLSFAAATAATAAAEAAYSPFLINPLTTHQPNGNPDGQTNYYHISFTVGSANGESGSAAGNCSAGWGDNSWVQSQAYSTAVPTGSWIACGASDFSFQLFPYFSIGNFTLAVQQNFTSTDADGSPQQILANGTLHITNATAQYTCNINPQEVKYEQHAHGDCSIPANASAFSIPVAASSVVVPCGASDNVTATFAVTHEPTTAGQNVLLLGSIPALGSWDPDNAILLSTADPNDSRPTYTATVDIPAGSDFEYKFIFEDTDGSETWECCENRTGSIGAGTCGDATVGNDPDYFRGGGDAVSSTKVKC